jgi:hypothetical protein
MSANHLDSDVMGYSSHENNRYNSYRQCSHAIIFENEHMRMTAVVQYVALALISSQNNHSFRSVAITEKSSRDFHVLADHYYESDYNTQHINIALTGTFILYIRCFDVLLM